MKALLIIFIALALASCSNTRKLTERNVSNVVTADSERHENNEKITNVVTERIDTTITIHADSAVVVRPLDDLLRGDTLKATTNGTTVRVTFDPNSNTLRAVGTTNHREVPVQAERTSTTVSERSSTSDLKSGKVEQDKTTTRSKEKTSIFDDWAWLIIIAGFCCFFLVIAAVYLWLRR